MSDTDLPDNEQDNGEEDVNQIIFSAESDPDLPKIYVNAAAGARSEADFALLFSRSDVPQVLVYMPLAMAKGIANSLTETFRDTEGDSDDKNDSE